MSVKIYKYNGGKNPTIIKDDGKVLKGRLIFNRKADRQVIKGERPSDIPNFKIRKEWFGDLLIYESEVDEWIKYNRRFETSRRVISHIIVEEKKPRKK